MAEKFIVPTSESVEELLQCLYGEDLTLAEGDAVESQSGYIANYISDDGDTVAVCVADNSFVANAGSSMMMIPAATARESAENNDISKVMLECYYEVVNILSRALMDATSGHLRLDKLSAPGEQTALLELFGADSKNVSFSIDIPGYGAGNVSFHLN